MKAHRGRSILMGCIRILALASPTSSTPTATPTPVVARLELLFYYYYYYPCSSPSPPSTSTAHPLPPEPNLLFCLCLSTFAYICLRLCTSSHYPNIATRRPTAVVDYVCGEGLSVARRVWAPFGAATCLFCSGLCNEVRPRTEGKPTTVRSPACPPARHLTGQPGGNSLPLSGGENVAEPGRAPAEAERDWSRFGLVGRKE
ncbi:unnamed protein product [Calypogeia fissa]